MNLPTKPESEWEAIQKAKEMGLSIHMYGTNELNIEDWTYWHVENRRLEKYFRIWKPWKMYFAWYGFGNNPNRLWELPFGIHCLDTWTITWRVYKGYREGVGNTPTAALGYYFCDTVGVDLCKKYSSCLGCPLDWVEPCGGCDTCECG